MPKVRRIGERPTKHDYFLRMATLVATRGTCARRAVGCVLVDNHGYVAATGYNGNGRGQTHCIDKPCAGAHYKSGDGLDKCEAIHAEQNALLQCKNTQELKECYITLSPCVMCVKMLLNTSVSHIIFIEEYVNTDAERIWKNAGRLWTHANAPLETGVKLGSTKRVSKPRKRPLIIF